MRPSILLLRRLSWPLLSPAVLLRPLPLLLLLWPLPLLLLLRPLRSLLWPLSSLLGMCGRWIGWARRILAHTGSLCGA